MNLSGIISIAGAPGLHKVVTQIKNGFIVESLIDKKRTPAYSSYKISTLEDISIFSTGEDVPLKEVLQKIADKENYGPSRDPKSNEEDLKKYFAEAFPEYDKDRVYISDIRKVIGWYNILQKNDLLKEKEESPENADKAKVMSTEDKPKISAPKGGPKNTAKPVRTNAPKKTLGVRKTGTA